jgi:hypothetical protein
VRRIGPFGALWDDRGAGLITRGVAACQITVNQSPPIAIIFIAARARYTGLMAYFDGIFARKKSQCLLLYALAG